MEQHQPGPELIGFAGCHAIRGLLCHEGIDLLERIVVAVDQPGVLIDENGIEQEFGGDVTEETDAGGIVILKEFTEQEREIGGDFEKALRGVKPVVVVEMLFDARGEFGLDAVGLCDKRGDVFHPQTDASIHHGEEIGQGGSCQEIGAIDESHSMGKVVHDTLSIANGLCSVRMLNRSGLAGRFTVATGGFRGTCPGNGGVTLDTSYLKRIMPDTSLSLTNAEFVPKVNYV